MCHKLPALISLLLLVRNCCKLTIIIPFPGWHVVTADANRGAFEMYILMAFMNLKATGMWSFCTKSSEYLKAALLLFLLHLESVCSISVSCDLKVYLFQNGFDIDEQDE